MFMIDAQFARKVLERLDNIASAVNEIGKAIGQSELTGQLQILNKNIDRLLELKKSRGNYREAKQTGDVPQTSR